MNISLDSAKLKARLKKADATLSKQIDKALEITASEGARNIVNRGLKGKGYAGSFKPYSVAYAKFRKKKGRKDSPVDLNFTGKMWASLIGKRVSSKIAEISFTSADANRKAFFNNRERPFFGFNSKDKKALLTFFERQIKL